MKNAELKNAELKNAAKTTTPSINKEALAKQQARRAKHLAEKNKGIKAEAKLASIKKVKCTQSQYAKSGTKEMGAFTLAAFIIMGLAKLNKTTKVVTTTGARISSSDIKTVMGDSAPNYWKNTKRLSQPVEGTFELTTTGASELTARVRGQAKACNHPIDLMSKIMVAMAKVEGSIINDKDNGLFLDVRQPLSK